MAKADDQKDIVQDLFDKGHELQEEYAALLQERSGVRDSLRNLAKAGMLTEPQLADLEELYPERKRNAEEVGDETTEPEAGLENAA